MGNDAPPPRQGFLTVRGLRGQKFRVTLRLTLRGRE